MSFDFSTIDVSETVEIEILHPATGEPMLGEGGKPCSVTTWGPGTKQFLAAESRANSRVVKRVRVKGNAEPTYEEDLAHKATFLADITVSLNNFTYQNGDPKARETFFALYSDPKLGFIVKRVNGEAGDWGNVLKPSETS